MMESLITDTYHTPPPAPSSLAPAPEADVPEEVSPVDATLAWAYPFFMLDGLLHTLVGLLALVLPALLDDTALPLQTMGVLLGMLALVQCTRSYIGRALPGFLSSLLEGVFKLVFGLMLCLYATHHTGTVVVLAVMTLATLVANVLHADAFRPLPYLGGFKFIAATALLAFVLLLIPTLNHEPLLLACIVGTLALLHGCLLLSLGLALKSMAYHQPLFHPLWEQSHSNTQIK
ncbi:MAG: hypothetical protein ACKO34_09450 [Vampirovibrionales bacterium]